MFFKMLDLIFLTRPVLLIPVWAFFVLGYAHGGQYVSFAPFSFGWTLPWLHVKIRTFYWLPGSAWLILFLFSILLAGIHVLNQIMDMDADRKNPGLALLASGIVGKNSALVQAVLFLAAPVAIMVAVRPGPGILFALALALGLAYCAPPLRLCGRPVFDFLANAAGYGGIAFFLGWVASGCPAGSTMIFSSLPYFFLMAAGSIASTIPDIPGDQVAGKKTTSVFFGIRASCAMAIACLGVSTILAWLFIDAKALFLSLFSLVFFIRLAVKPIRQNAYPAYQWGGGALVFLAFCQCPIFFILSLLVVWITRLYFRLQHGILYPRLGH